MWMAETNSASSLRHRMPRATVTHRVLKAKPPQNAVAPNSTVRRQIIFWENFVRRSYESPKIKSIKSNKFDQSNFFSFLHTLPGGRTQPRAVPITVSRHIFSPPRTKGFRSMMATRPFACVPKRRSQAICGLTSWQSKLRPCETPKTRPVRGDRLHLTAEKRASLYIPPPSHCPSCPPVGFSRHLLLRLAISAG